MSKIYEINNAIFCLFTLSYMITSFEIYQYASVFIIDLVLFFSFIIYKYACFIMHLNFSLQSRIVYFYFI